MSIEKAIKQLEQEIQARNELVVAVQSLMSNEIGHCTVIRCEEDSPCLYCKDRKRILDLIFEMKKYLR